MIDVDVSIDKCSFVAKPTECAQEWVSGLGGFEESARWSSRHPESREQTVSFKVRTVFVSAQVAWRNDGRLGWAPKEQPVRVEFNPNKVSAADVSVVFGMLTSVRATRYDVALDYPGVQLGEFSFTRKGTKAAYFTARGGEPEGLYLGSLASLVVFRTYDKIREIMSKTKKVNRDAEAVRLAYLAPTGLARVECVQRLRPGYQERAASEVCPEDLFDRVSAIRRVVPYDGLRPYEMGLLALYHYEPDVLRTLDKDVRKRASELAVSRCGELCPSPREVYRERRSEIREWCEELRRGRVVDTPVARVYSGGAGGDKEGTAGSSCGAV